MYSYLSTSNSKNLKQERKKYTPEVISYWSEDKKIKYYNLNNN